MTPEQWLCLHFITYELMRINKRHCSTHMPAHDRPQNCHNHHFNTLHVRNVMCSTAKLHNNVHAPQNYTEPIKTDQMHHRMHHRMRHVPGTRCPAAGSLNSLIPKNPYTCIRNFACALFDGGCDDALSTPTNTRAHNDGAH